MAIRVELHDLGVAPPEEGRLALGRHLEQEHREAEDVAALRVDGAGIARVLGRVPVGVSSVRLDAKSRIRLNEEI